MQEIVGKMGYHKDRPLYQAYVQESVITAIILSYLTTSNSKFNSMKMIFYTDSYINTRTIKMHDYVIEKRRKNCFLLSI